MNTAAGSPGEMPALPRLPFPALLLFFFLCTAAGAMAAPSPDEIVLAEVKMENVPFRKAFSTIQMLVEEKHLKIAIDPVHDIPKNFDNSRAFTFARKNAALSDLLTSFCRYYGLDWKHSGDTVVFSLPRPYLKNNN